MTTKELGLLPVPFDEKAVLARMLELYLHDLSEFDDGLRLNGHGLFGYRYLDHYWSEDGRYPFFIMLGNQQAGFALVRQLPNEVYEIAEFFVLRGFRRHGIGWDAAKQLFDRFPGVWEVRELERNVPSQVFWRRVIGEYTSGKYTEHRDGSRGDIVQQFSSG